MAIETRSLHEACACLVLLKAVGLGRMARVREEPVTANPLCANPGLHGIGNHGDLAEHAGWWHQKMHEGAPPEQAAKEAYGQLVEGAEPGSDLAT